MAALAGVAADRVWQFADPQQGPQQRAAEETPARVAAGRVVTEGPQIVRLAERAGERVRPGGERFFYALVLSDSSALHQ